MIDTIFNELIEMCVKIPLTTPIIFGLLFIMTLDVQFAILLIIVIFDLIFNPIIKSIMKIIYKKSGRTSLPILGLGYRPNSGKIHCGVFNKKNNKDGTKTFGMPSGHSQIIWSIISYSLIVMYNRTKNDENFIIVYPIKFIILILLGLFVSLSRVYMGCHTIRQIIVGGIIGSGIGIGAYYIYPNPPILE